MQFKLNQKEAQTILSASFNFMDDIEKLQKEDNLSVFWKIMFNDFKSAINRLEKQYKNQLHK
ncbi:MAG: hypothetical protein QF864_09810 [SAR202 cluster bacterium]|jgi:hypothetical protein|nr:hypothetical protein [SAR202 cluster bacterium]|tara:strand:+ start:1321 stop:1506 length:186 start_codon:yes stop_codon:yes gene_type:complete